MLRDKNESESPELHCKFKSFDEVIESQYFRIMHCVCLQEVDSRPGKDPAENDLVVLICPDEHTTEVFGVIEEVEKTPLRDDDGKQDRREGGRGGERCRARASNGPVKILCLTNLLLLEISAVHYYGNSSSLKDYLQDSSTLMTIYILQTVVLIFLFHTKLVLSSTSKGLFIWRRASPLTGLELFAEISPHL